MTTSTKLSLSPDRESLEIAELLHAGDQRAIERLVSNYSVYLFRNLSVKFHRFLSAEDLEEVLQDTFFRAYQKGKHYDPSLASVKTWLSRLATYCALDLIRREQKRPTQSLSGYEVSPQATDTSATHTEVKGPSPWMEAALQQLPPKPAACVRMFYYEGLDTKAIAQKLEINPTTVRVHLSHAHKDLRRLLGGYTENSEGTTP